MPLLGIDTYIIDFAVLESNDPKSITILDKSVYLDVPEKPLLDIILPGFTGVISVPYLQGTIITINSDNLHLTEACEYGELASLPDGVYQITMKVCPYDELFTKKCWLKTSALQAMFQNVLLGLDDTCFLSEDKKVRETIMDIEILLLSAKAEVNICNVQKATLKYQTALKKIQSLAKKLNC